MTEEDINKRVFLLAILKKEANESLLDVTKMLADTGMFDLNEGEKLLDDLKKEGYIVNEQLSIIGGAVAEAALKEFTL